MGPVIPIRSAKANLRLFVYRLPAQSAGFRWNQKRVYRIYRELKLNLRIKSRKRLVRENPERLGLDVIKICTWAKLGMARAVF